MKILLELAKIIVVAMAINIVGMVYAQIAMYQLMMSQVVMKEINANMIANVMVFLIVSNKNV
jgi:hypothetical protein